MPGDRNADFTAAAAHWGLSERVRAHMPRRPKVRRLAYSLDQPVRFGFGRIGIYRHSGMFGER